ncbi:hypothetical protein FRB96_005846 [Tulasnella sp. 330]|nr:hypothetical protein FRB96_005846 [Tulasnella sp. 330]KAG8873686.1 hypothetical protein FRB98_008845 [Tulasnella sp. 332]
MLNPEASSSKVSVSSATLPAYNPPGIPPNLGSFKLSAAERLDDLRPGLEYIQQYLTENGWALEEFLTRAQNLWILWQEEVKRAQGTTLSARYGLGGHSRASTLRRDVSQLIKTMRDRGTKKALEKSAQDLKRAQKSREKSENSARPQKAEPLEETRRTLPLTTPSKP